MSTAAHDGPGNEKAALFEMRRPTVMQNFGAQLHYAGAIAHQIARLNCHEKA